VNRSAHDLLMLLAKLEATPFPYTAWVAKFHAKDLEPRLKMRLQGQELPQMMEFHASILRDREFSDIGRDDRI